MPLGDIGKNGYKSKATAHVVVDLQCWHCKALIE